jgi:hypothetical protein
VVALWGASVEHEVQTQVQASVDDEAARQGWDRRGGE